MERRELIADMKKTVGSSFITLTEIGKYIHQTNLTRVKKEYLIGLERLGKRYFIPDVVTRLMEGRRFE